VQMSLFGMLLLALSAILTMAANLALREGIVSAGGFRPTGAATLVTELVKIFLQPVFLAGFITYFLAALVWFRVIASEPLSIAYPVLVGLTFVLVTSGAVLVFREPISTQRIIGLGIILCGIVIASTATPS
jgi:multidrug transporter EmrE-like cation transporter